MLRIKNRNILSISKKCYTIKIRPKRVINLPKSQIKKIIEKERETIFFPSEWISKILLL
jgi:hypothetical protein